MEKTARPPNSARSEEKVNSSRGVPPPATERIGSARSTTSSVPESSRSVLPNSSRSDHLDSARTSMSTARVHTVLAALTAEKQALLSKLQSIDAALESGEKKKMKTRTGK
eukprot:gene4286-4706_t